MIWREKYDFETQAQCQKLEGTHQVSEKIVWFPKSENAEISFVTGPWYETKIKHRWLFLSGLKDVARDLANRKTLMEKFLCSHLKMLPHYSENL